MEPYEIPKQQDEAYDPSLAQSYYTYAYSYNQQHQYPHYPSHYTAINYQQQSQNDESASIHPPGVPIPLDSSTHLNPPDYEHTHLQNQHIGYYQHGTLDEERRRYLQGNGGGFSQIPVRNPQIGQPSFRGGGGGGRRGRGRGRGRGRVGFPGKGRPGPSLPPQCMAWCELCRVDCNSLDILEQHKNGKKHKKNLKIQDELQNLNKVITEMQTQQTPGGSETNHIEKVTTEMQTYQTPVSEIKPETNQIEKVNGSPEKQPPLAKMDGSQEKLPAPENLPFQITLTGPSKEVKKKGKGKRKRTHDSSSQSTEPSSQPKQAAVSLLCELCNVKCESQVVFDSHLAGKRHMSNLKQYHDYQAVLGVAVLQALCQDPYTLSQVLASASASAPAPEQASMSVAIPLSHNDETQDSSMHDSQTATEPNKELMPPTISATANRVSEVHEKSTQNYETAQSKPRMEEASVALEPGNSSAECVDTP